jgi:hypothetical protein
MYDLAESLAVLIRDALRTIPPPTGQRRPSTTAIYETLKALKKARKALEQAFGGPVRCRYPGCPPVESHGKKTRKVLGYLWDFSFSRFTIPEAIGQQGDSVPAGRKYEMLFVAESELGTPDEICRDLLKLLDARAAVRCLIYRQPKEPRALQRLHARMIRVLQNHAHFELAGNWVFVGLSWRPGSIAVEAYALAAGGLGLVVLPQSVTSD